ncbi:fungal-specific transcription factor domain-domain-containing protein [Lobosporangium transversale]|uniref:Fungal-specific transcription factor domain-domain-containing protein n=1 Tax=Lobosporangium transversale TaxID=64571 RepID=A0A1Y2GWC4_9FUNG|nr:fungal-specific transcription factor domain-domain-containing protein [Lobosporangium transversale]ORZ24898.1 fungal-specific transcription factor domain-domain-containing protein [Lobosporangium transversale]|eukprot:XP_021883879.1 fungal-specific transcription factor domain-domain-containing protein [Lobosporangium transversale]
MPAVASLPQLVQKESSSQFAPRLPSSGLAADRDTMMPDLYHIFVNSVTIPNVARYSQSTLQANSSAIRFGGSVASTGVNQFNLALASPAIPTFAVLNADHTDPDQQHSSFQRDPAANSFLDQTTPLGFVITNKSVIQYLVHVYFECFHFHWMIVDKEKFLAQLKDPCSPPDPLLLVAICAAGAKYSDHEGLCAEPGNFATIGEQFLTHARILLQDRFDVPSMSTLQALLILYWCQVQTGRASLRFMYVGMAIRMAQVMGLNRPVDPKRLKDMDEREVQIRKTIWWSCYQADRWTSAALGKPMVISDVDCLVDYPASLSESERYYVESFHHMTDLAKILGKVILSLYTSTNAATCSSAVFSHLDQSLSEWFDSMPSISAPNEAENVLPTPTSLDSAGSTPSARSSTLQRGKPSTGSKSAIPTMKSPDTTTAASLAVPKPDSSSIGYYELLFHTVRIMLYRPFLHNSALTPILPLTLQSPQSQCRESAAAISEIAENMVTEQRSYRQLFNSIHISLCAAATVHRFVIISSKTSSSQSTGPEAEDTKLLVLYVLCKLTREFNVPWR